ncbi:E3 ubiquitin-protein ligase rha1b-like protein [Trifolium pratense]|uniref:E3 ubiquitin-protein ligase rha1b-like protein n=1 Tax=Trifolium pratense TaxID=57577 RepID=A0A2K3KF32_TRIPR|nr:brassinosteroid-responsive RING protein 1-like [Trifolium pratense]PNX64905.1 E3 ubiquitin-protein ligase rha1b-like protein [Trifolium pratense]
MGFPVGYPEVSVSNLFLYTLPLLAFLRSIAITFLSLLHLSDILDTDFSVISSSESHLHRPTLSAILIRQFLPVVNFSVIAGDSPPAAECAVCLNEFVGEEEIRCMANCRHIFHRTCVDRWIDHDQKTCPLCRTHFVPYHKMEDYNQRLWAASASDDDDYDVSLFSLHDDHIATSSF